jgi:hypothetical protein
MTASLGSTVRLAAMRRWRAGQGLRRLTVGDRWEPLLGHVKGTVGKDNVVWTVDGHQHTGTGRDVPARS